MLWHQCIIGMSKLLCRRHIFNRWCSILFSDQCWLLWRCRFDQFMSKQMFGWYISFIYRWNITIFVFQCQCGMLWFCWCNVIMSCIVCQRYLFNRWCICLYKLSRR